MKVHCYIEPHRSFWKQLCGRPQYSLEEGSDEVKQIIESVRSKGDEALPGYEKLLKVSSEEIAEAESLVDDSLKDAIREAHDGILRFNEALLPSTVRVETSPGVVCVQKPVPVNRVGLYVSREREPQFVTVLTLAVPAKVAGCPEVIICTPPDKDGRVNPAILYAASICGIEDIYKVGGAHAIAAMAFGTESVPRCDKIVGSGDSYALEAKKALSGILAIALFSGPPEVMVLADDSANPAFVASDFLSQSDSGPNSQSILVCSSHSMVVSIMNEAREQYPALSNKDDMIRSLLHSKVVVFMDRNSIIDFANMYAPEHLIIQMENPWEVADKIRTAGSVVIGPWSPGQGPRYTLPPTRGWARSVGSINVDTFLRKMTIQELTEDGLKKVGSAIRVMAKSEGLNAHAATIEYRLGEE